MSLYLFAKMTLEKASFFMPFLFPLFCPFHNHLGYRMFLESCSIDTLVFELLIKFGIGKELENESIFYSKMYLLQTTSAKY